MIKSYTQPQARKVYWAMQMGEPLKNPNFSQQQCKCNKRQLVAQNLQSSPMSRCTES